MDRSGPERKEKEKNGEKSCGSQWLKVKFGV